MTVNKHIKLFIDAHCFDKEFQGARTFIKELYRELSQQTNYITFYIGAFDIDNIKKEFNFIKDCHFVKYKFSSAILRLNIDIPRIIKKHQIDVAHFQYIIPFYKTCKYIVTTHDILFNDFKKEFSLPYRIARNVLFKFSIKQADIKTTVSNYSKNRICFHYGSKQKDLFVIPNGVSSVFYEPYIKQDSINFIKEKYNIENFVLYVSRIEPRKNHIALLHTFLSEELYKKGISLVFIGKTSIKNELLTKTVRDMPIDATSHFFKIEQVNDKDLINFYKASRAFVYPSKAEGFGIPPLEACALKIPVICSNTTAMSDFTFLKDSLFNPLDEHELASKLNKILFSAEDTSKYEVISTEIQRHYSWKTSANTFLSLIENSVNKI